MSDAEEREEPARPRLTARSRRRSALGVIVILLAVALVVAVLVWRHDRARRTDASAVTAAAVAAPDLPLLGTLRRRRLLVGHRLRPGPPLHGADRAWHLGAAHVPPPHRRGLARGRPRRGAGRRARGLDADEGPGGARRGRVGGRRSRADLAGLARRPGGAAARRGRGVVGHHHDDGRLAAPRRPRSTGWWPWPEPSRPPTTPTWQAGLERRPLPASTAGTSSAARALPHLGLTQPDELTEIASTGSLSGVVVSLLADGIAPGHVALDTSPLTGPSPITEHTLEVRRQPAAWLDATGPTGFPGQTYAHRLVWSEDGALLQLLVTGEVSRDQAVGVAESLVPLTDDQWRTLLFPTTLHPDLVPLPPTGGLVPATPGPGTSPPLTGG